MPTLRYVLSLAVVYVTYGPKIVISKITVLSERKNTLEVNLCRFFYHLLISAFPLEKEVIGISLTNLTLPHFCACAKPGSGCPMLYLVVMLMFNELR